MTTSLRSLVAALDDDPWCGTRPPHWPPLPPRLGSLEEIISAASLAERVSLNPQPLPPRSAQITAIQQQVRLFQLGESLQALRGAPADIGGQMSALASDAFDGTCGSVPLSVLIQILLHHPPPPPAPWLQDIEQAAMQTRLSARMEGSTGASLQHAAIGMLKSQLGALTEKAQVRMG